MTCRSLFEFWPDDRCRQRVTERRLSAQDVLSRYVFLLDCCSWTHLVILWVFGVAGLNSFLTMDRIMLTQVTIFINNCFEWLTFAWQFASFSSGAWRFLHKNISQGSGATCFRMDGISLIIKRLLNLSVNFKNRSPFCKVLDKIVVTLFYPNMVYYYIL